jgi:hypothetical protein
MLDLSVGHWTVETVHNVLDCSFREDACKVWAGNSAENLSILRKMGISLIAPIYKRFKEAKESMRSIFRALADWDCLMEYLTKDSSEVRHPDWWRGRQEGE